MADGDNRRKTGKLYGNETPVREWNNNANRLQSFAIGENWPDSRSDRWNLSLSISLCLCRKQKKKKDWHEWLFYISRGVLGQFVDSLSLSCPHIQDQTRGVGVDREDLQTIANVTFRLRISPHHTLATKNKFSPTHASFGAEPLYKKSLFFFSLLLCFFEAQSWVHKAFRGERRKIRSKQNLLSAKKNPFLYFLLPLYFVFFSHQILIIEVSHFSWFADRLSVQSSKLRK